MIEMNPDFTKFLVELYGKEAQLGTLAEEGIEFSKEFLKYMFRSDKDKHWENMQDEFADFLIMLEQAKVIFDMDVVYAEMKRKLDRLSKYLEMKDIEHPIAYTEVI